MLVLAKLRFVAVRPTGQRSCEDRRVPKRSLGTRGKVHVSELCDDTVTDRPDSVRMPTKIGLPREERSPAWRCRYCKCEVLDAPSVMRDHLFRVHSIRIFHDLDFASHFRIPERPDPISVRRTESPRGTVMQCRYCSSRKPLVAKLLEDQLKKKHHMAIESGDAVRCHFTVAESAPGRPAPTIPAVEALLRHATPSDAQLIRAEHRQKKALQQKRRRVEAVQPGPGLSTGEARKRPYIHKKGR